MEIETTRDIARQILRHRSFSFQELSQRYAVVHDYDFSEVRLQDNKDRQNSIEVQDRELQRFWQESQATVIRTAVGHYEAALANGIAKEVARKLLPEGMMMSRMYANATLRSWLHYINIRCDKSTQKEHREVADQCRVVIKSLFPSLFEDVK
jgi:thymidylate synthase (FAD)